MNTCKNCHHKFKGRYCNNCGQKASTGRLTLRSVMDNLAYGMTNCDTGILFTYKELFTRPGRMCADYIEGKRVTYFSPFPMLIVTAGFYGLLSGFLLPGSLVVPELIETAETVDATFWSRLYNNLHNWKETSMSFAAILTLPFFALASTWAFRSKKRLNYNFTEYLFIYAYFACQRLMVGLALKLPFLLYTNDTELHGKKFLGFWAIYFGFTVWDLKQLIGLKTWPAITRTLLMYVYWAMIAIVLFIIICALTIVIHNLGNPSDPVTWENL